MEASAYALDQSWYGERDRLRSLSAIYDPVSLAWCERSGLKAGARVLELGAGAGKLAEAMAERVGSGGRVIAADRDVRFLADLVGRVEVIEMDLLRDPLPAGPFDLVHARLLLAHLGHSRPILEQWARALAPGGWLVVEDVDTAGCGECVPPSRAFSAVAVGLFDELARRGFDQRLGLRLPALLAELGLGEVEACGLRTRARGDPQKGIPPWDLLAAQLAPSMIETGRLGQADYDEFTRITHDATVWCGTPMLTTARGRRVASGRGAPRDRLTGRRISRQA